MTCSHRFMVGSPKGLTPLTCRRPKRWWTHSCEKSLTRHMTVLSCARRTTMEIPRPAPPRSAPEREMLEAWLDFHRLTLERKCSGLSPEQLRRRAVPPSALSLLGLVRHMAEVERNWFRRALAHEDAPPHYRSDNDPNGAFNNVDTADVEEAFATWRAECAYARTVVASFS